MLDLINYQLSIFGNYNFLPGPELISNLMYEINAVGNMTFLPNLIRSQQIDIGLNKLIDHLNIGFITSDQQYNIIFFNNRIDIGYKKIDGNVVTLSDFNDIAVSLLCKIIEAHDLSANRMALNIDGVFIVDDSEELQSIGKSLIGCASYYQNRTLVDWSGSVNTYQNIDVNGLEETVNVKTSFTSGIEIREKMLGMLFHIDINTLAEKQLLRFNSNAVISFVDNVAPIADTIIKDIEEKIKNG